MPAPGVYGERDYLGMLVPAVGPGGRASRRRSGCQPTPGPPQDFGCLLLRVALRKPPLQRLDRSPCRGRGLVHTFHDDLLHRGMRDGRQGLPAVCRPASVSAAGAQLPCGGKPPDVLGDHQQTGGVAQNRGRFGRPHRRHSAQREDDFLGTGLQLHLDEGRPGAVVEVRLWDQFTFPCQVELPAPHPEPAPQQLRPVGLPVSDCLPNQARSTLDGLGCADIYSHLLAPGQAPTQLPSSIFALGNRLRPRPGHRRLIEHAARQLKLMGRYDRPALTAHRVHPPLPRDRCRRSAWHSRLTTHHPNSDHPCRTAHAGPPFDACPGRKPADPHGVRTNSPRPQRTTPRGSRRGERPRVLPGCGRPGPAS